MMVEIAKGQMQKLNDRKFVVKLKPEGAGSCIVLAERIEIHDEHLALLHSSGRLTGLFLTESVEVMFPLPVESEFDSSSPES
jgi:hypothetical protein